jgi:hypothetical protein
MSEISENTKDLVTSCMIQRLSTREALDYLKKNKVNVSERTFRRYKNEILKQQHTLESYGWNNVQIEQVKKIETKKSILRQCWKLFEQSNTKSFQHWRRMLFFVSIFFTCSIWTLFHP